MRAHQILMDRIRACASDELTPSGSFAKGSIRGRSWPYPQHIARIRITCFIRFATTCVFRKRKTRFNLQRNQWNIFRGYSYFVLLTKKDWSKNDQRQTCDKNRYACASRGFTRQSRAFSIRASSRLGSQSGSDQTFKIDYPSIAKQVVPLLK